VHHEKVVDAMKCVVEQSKAAGKTVGTFADDAEMAQRWVNLGVQYVMLSVDAPILVRALRGLAPGYRQMMRSHDELRRYGIRWQSISKFIHD